jgi:hypothetical protein
MTAKLRVRGFVVAGMMYVALAASLSGAAESFEPAADGWHSWIVPAPPGAGVHCCHSWSGASAKPCACDLESGHGGLFGHGNTPGLSGDTRIYVLMEAGQPNRIAALSPYCEVHTATTITDHGSLNADASADWLRQFVGADSRVASQALAALALHAGDHALQVLIGMVESGSDDTLREEALFWLIQSGSDAGFAYVDRLLTAD